ncbi:1067_t:CDS:1, partial [Scutellospora calospora]
KKAYGDWGIDEVLKKFFTPRRIFHKMVYRRFPESHLTDRPLH